MSRCPNFDCLDFSQSVCERFPACDGCAKLYDCNSCTNQASLIDGKALPCDMIRLPERCRFCSGRREQSFSPAESCTSCPAHRALQA